MMYKIAASLLAISVNEVIETGKTVGTSSNQVILGFLVVALILVVLYREWQQVRANKDAVRRHEDLTTRLDKERGSWEEERRQRIAMLMTLVQDNTKAMERSASSQSSVAEAVGVNSTAVNALRDLIYDIQLKTQSRRKQT